MVEAPALVDRLEPYGSELDERIVAATLDCVAHWGLAKTTLDDIARAAGCSRATVYRTFPGGKDTLIEHVGQRELERFFGALARELAEVATLEDAIVIAIGEASLAIRRHAALQYLCAHEREVLLPYLSFDGIEPLLLWSAEFSAVHLSRFIPPHVARDLGEWACRIVLAYSELETPVLIDLTDPAATREFVRTFVLPGVAALGDPTAGVVDGSIDLTADRSTTATTSTIAPQSGPATATGFAPVAELDPASTSAAPPQPALVHPEE